MKGFQSYIDYLMLKRHFNTDSFIWNENNQYNRIKETSFQKRKDITFFIKLETISSGNRRDWINKIVSGFIYDQDFWIGSIFNDEHNDFHNYRMKRFLALESTFERELEELEFYLTSNSISFDDSLLTFGTKDPIIVNRFLRPTSLETFAVLENFTNFTRMWFPINPLQQLRKNLIYKYSMLLRLNERNLAKMKEKYQQLSATLAPSAPAHI